MYTEHYGLSGHPFQLTPDPRFWFESETHRKAMAYLGYGLAQGEGFIVITGDIGAGKTTLVGHLLATIDTARLSAVKIVSTQLDSADMLRMVAQQLGLATEGAEKAQLLDRIERYLHAQARDGKRTLVIVDEAQNLPISALEELRMLSNFQSGGRALVQIFLLGQPEFRDRLRSAPHLEQLRQRVIATHHLDSMEPAEVEPYLAHRLALVGWQGNPRFTHDAHAALYHATDGVPRRLNTLAGRVLLLGAVENLSDIDADAVHSVLADLDEDAENAPSPFPLASEPERQGRDGPRPSLNHAGGMIDPDASGHWVGGGSEEGPKPFEPAGVEWPLSPPLAERAINDDTPAPRAASPVFDSREARLAALESRLEEQEAALRRALTLLVDWVENEDAARAPILRNSAA